MEGVQAAAAPPVLWTTLREFMRGQRLRVTDLARLSRVSRPAIYTIKRGVVPMPVTLADLARGLASDPYEPDRIDRALYRRFYRALFEAAGYPVEAGEVPGRPAGISGDGLVESIRRAFGTDAGATEDFLRSLPNLSPANRALVLETVVRLRALVRELDGENEPKV